MNDNSEPDRALVDFATEDDKPLDKADAEKFREAVLYSSDWTVETIIALLTRRAINLNPHFQRRDAWPPKLKSQFIESIILGLPIPQIVLAEQQQQRGKYIVLDGKQRLLTLLQFVGQAEDSPHNAFALRALDVRQELIRKRYRHLESEPRWRSDLDNFLAHTIRAVLIRNWPNAEFLHTVFLRLNTGSVKLSPQELRQALFPGAFSDYIDEASAASEPLRHILSQPSADPRMRDVELLVRFLAFRNFINSYEGRMKNFLDSTCGQLNHAWDETCVKIKAQVEEFNKGTVTLINIFGTDQLARKGGSRSFNRAIFDALIFYGSVPAIRLAMIGDAGAVRTAYDEALQNGDFVKAVEIDTAGVPNTQARLAIWGSVLAAALRMELPVPRIDENRENRIAFPGFPAS